MRKKVILLAGSFSMVLAICILLPRYRIVEKVSPQRLDRSFSFGLADGLYDEDITIQISTNVPLLKETEIYYTMDGSMPDRRSKRYEQPLTFRVEDGLKVIHLRASVYQGETLVGGPYDGTWLLTNVPESLQDMLIVSIIADKDDLFSPEYGILYPPKSYVSTSFEGGWDEVHAQNFAQKGEEWVRPAQIKIFEGNGRVVINQKCGLSVSGNHGAIMHYPFSLNCKADSSYDPDKNRFLYDFFGEQNLKQSENYYYDSISLKNSGNDYYWGELRDDVRGTMLRNTVGLRMADEAGLLASKQRLALVYLNGEFYNLAYLSTNPNEKTLSVKTGLNDEYIVVDKEGERYAFTYFKLKKLYHCFPDIENSHIFERREKFERKVNMEELFRYYAFECIVGNADWPRNNYAMWRYIGNENEGNPYSDGKFRHWVYDLDCIYNLEDWLDDPWVALFENPNGETCLLITLLQIEDYRNQFINTVLDQMNSETFSEEHILEIIEEENNRFAPWFQWVYGEEAELGRQENVALLKQNVLARREQVMRYLERYFQVNSPYELQMLPSDRMGVVHMNSLYLDNELYDGMYDSSYPVKIEYIGAAGDMIDYWIVNGERVETPELTITAGMIKDGMVTVEPVTMRKKGVVRIK